MTDGQPENGGAGTVLGAEPTTSEPVSIIGQDGKLAEKWYETDYVPEEYRKEPVLQRLGSFSDVVKSLVNAERVVGKDKFTLPNEKSLPQEWEDFYSKIGRPKTATDYKFAKDETLPKEVWDDNLIGSALTELHKVGASQKVIDVIAGIENKRVAEMIAQYESNRVKTAEKTVETLKKDWSDSFDQKILAGNVAVNKGVNGDKEFQGRLLNLRLADGSLLGDNLDFTKFTSNLGSMFGEHSASEKGGQKSMSDIDSEIKKINDNADFVSGKLKNSNRAEHDRLVALRDELYKKKYPDKA